MKKPIYVGMSVLDLSKQLMYSFYYLSLKEQYGDRVRMLYTDTDSLILEMQTKDLYGDMSVTPEVFDLYDTSNFPPDHPIFSNANKKVVGKFKDELGGRAIYEFVGLRSKMYAYEGEASGMRAKGVNKPVLASTINMADYVRVLEEESACSRTMPTLRSRMHRIYGESMLKTALSCFDSKRYIADDGKHTFAYGHCHIES